ncbi:prepilin-type N-terminal cleavage/methylation domain-containing protein [Terribacillus sp. AE2B 122]|uniref:prepilin-type N-terminal cleavage/methylation domain-containing protein n=1 Tax=Terribacillus sp. AE2B 122 TaxID=1331902 RepID=UPI0015823106|nr:prepilin-type N-terminal cleavage/methylation domain-containing protein [Terribacillus sp. AE2B 122]
MSNEKGFTLIELLGGLLLFSIVTIAAVSLVVQSMHNSANAEATNSLRNDATYVTQVLRTAYENGTLDGMCLEEEQNNRNDKNYKLKSAENEIKLDLTDQNELLNLQFSYVGSDSNRPDCFNSQSDKQTLQVNFTISRDESESFGSDSYTVDTAFSKIPTEQLTINLQEPIEEPDGDSQIGYCKIVDTEKGFDKEKKNDSVSMYDGDLNYSQSQYASWNQGTYNIVNGNTTFSNNNISIFKDYFKVTKDLSAKGSMDLQNTADVNVDQSTIVNKDLKLLSYASLDTYALKVNNLLRLDENTLLLVHTNLEVGSGGFYSNTTICTGGNSTYNGSMDFHNFSIYKSGGSLNVSNNLNLFKLANLSTVKDMNIGGNVKLENSAKIEVGGSTTIKGGVEVKGSSSIYSKKNIVINGNLLVQEGSILYSDGDIDIKGTVSSDNGAGIICSKGKITINKLNKASGIKILPNNQKCQK